MLNKEEKTAVCLADAWSSSSFVISEREKKYIYIHNLLVNEHQEGEEQHVIQVILYSQQRYTNKFTDSIHSILTSKSEWVFTRSHSMQFKMD